jgi:hypothetical protein
MEDITEVAEVLTSASNHKTATLLTAATLVITTGAIYGIGKLVGKSRQKKLSALPQCVQDNIDFIEANAN